MSEIINDKNIALNKQIKIYPNPFTNQFTLNCDDGLISLNEIQIRNIFGKNISNLFIVKNINKQEVKISLKTTLDKGVYLVVVKQKDAVIIKKITH